ncbi:glycosyl hydrolases family 2 domain-containing protein [Sarocladium implicatum]|nr:glycosyl hydrolases family 2 domain-containing protein [Sarocladium implicatum]
MSLRKVTPIDKDWQFKRADETDDSFLAVSQFPTQVHLDLLHHNKIPDFNIGKNELDVQWVGEVEWLYKTSFATPKLQDGEKAVLAFEGLDTFATVKLNGHTVLESDNMFTPERVEISPHLKADGEENTLSIHFASASKRGQQLVDKHPEHTWVCANGDVSRLAVRKAQYHWGWDWGPKLITAGPWRPISLEVYSSRVHDLYTETKLSDSLGTAEVVVHAILEGEAPKVRFEASIGDEIIASETVTPGQESHATATFAVSKPRLWWPRGYGDQPLYTIRATVLEADGTELDVCSKRIGLRKAEVVQNPFSDGTPGSSFFFRINNEPIFCGGSNWIPADNFICRISPERYYDWVKLVASGNQVMLRVWAGGIYEEEALYNACDEMGILVWQDFMFGCGNYPTFPQFLESVKREAIENIKLLRHHPSIVIWAGNNEDYQIAEDNKLTCDYQDKDPQSWLKTNFPARYIYESLLPSICKEIIPDTFYHPGSPWGAPKKSDDLTVGDVHQWNIWHGSQLKYQDAVKLTGRFISEFGMEAFPSVKTIDGYLPLGKDDPDRYPQSSTIDFHNKAAGHERRLALYLVENMRYTVASLEDYVYSTQLMQAECLSSCYRIWRREWAGPGKEKCAGVLVWQINDCWPVTSWAICDYHLRPKHAYHSISRELQPITVGLERLTTEKQRKENIGRPECLTTLRVWASNLTLGSEKVHCTLKFWVIKTGEELEAQEVTNTYTLHPNQTTEFAGVTFDTATRFKEEKENAQIVVGAYLTKEDKTPLARYIDWPQPLKYVHFAKPQSLKVRVAPDLKSVEVSAEVPVKGVAVECNNDAVKFLDNLVDVVPGETVRIAIEGATQDTEFTTRCLNLIG